MTNHKTAYYYLLAIAFFGAILIGYITYLLYFPVKTLEVKNAPMPIIGSQVLKAGDYVTYRYDYCKYYDHPLSIQRDFVDGVIYRTDEAKAQLAPGCHVADVRVIIPETLPAGEYKIRNITQIVVNQFRIEEVTYESGYFQVIK